MSISATDVDERAQTARRLLDELASASLPALKKKNRGKVLEASLKQGFFCRLLSFWTGGFRIVSGREVWRLGAKALDLGITEDGALGITDGGELVRMSTWLTPDGARPVDPRGLGSRFRQRLAGRAQGRGCDGAVSMTAVEAYGEPQRETRFNKDYRNVFYLGDTGELVVGQPGSTIDAAEWFANALK